MNHRDPHGVAANGGNPKGAAPLDRPERSEELALQQVEHMDDEDNRPSVGESWGFAGRDDHTQSARGSKPDNKWGPLIPRKSPPSPHPRTGSDAPRFQGPDTRTTGSYGPPPQQRSPYWMAREDTAARGNNVEDRSSQPELVLREHHGEPSFFGAIARAFSGEAPAVSPKKPLPRAPLPPREAARRPEPRGPETSQHRADAAGNLRLREEIVEMLYLQGWIDTTQVEVLVRGGEVTLSGAVAEESDKVAIEQLVAHVRGVSEIHNGLHRKPPSTAPAGDR